MKRAWIPLLLLTSSTVSLFADPGDPPARVARLNYISGAVSYRPGAVEEWVAATPNYPMTTGDHLWADQGAGAELHIGSTAIRLASQTALEFLNLDDRVAQLSIREGGMEVRLRRLDDDQTFEIDTPNGAISLLRAGDYRVDVSPDENATYVTVRGGEAEINGAGNPFAVHPREMARIAGDPAAVDVSAARPPDAWDQWCLERDRREDEAATASARYVPREMVGYEDLAAYGVWRPMPGYGTVWVPRVQVGWAPYHFGHWAWVDPWGWTWIDDAPWGFAPFHYGRWAYAGGAWVWAPGTIVARPVYAPALVAFVGGPHFSLAVGVGGGVAGVAWFPLGPREVYVPAYRVSTTYVREVNVTHVTNINVTNVNVTNVRYVNQTVPGAVTAVPHAAFAGAQPVARAAVQVNPQVIARAQVVQAAPVAPSRASFLGRAPSGNAAQPPAAVRERAVVARSTPPPPPVPFAARQQALQANPGRPLDQSTMNTLRSNAPAPRPAVRTVGQNGRPLPAGRQPARVNAEQPAVGAPGRPIPVRPNVDRPANAGNERRNPVRPNVDRPANTGIERPNPVRPNVERPNVNTERPNRPNVERPANRPDVERPANRPNVERPPAAERPRATPPARSEPRPAAREERRQQRNPPPNREERKREQ